MAALHAEKIFVDPKEEISFLVEKLLNSEKENNILIVPQNSVLFTSVLSLKILYRQALMDQKTVIIVTEDAYGTNLSQRAGFVVVQKVSQITSDLWEIAKSKQEASMFKFEEHKKALLEGRSPNVPAKEIVEEEKDDVVEIEESYDFDENVDEDGNTIDPLAAVPAKLEEDNARDVEAAREEIVKSLDGIEIFAGEDIEEFRKSEEDAKINMLDNNTEEMAREREIDTSNFSNKKFAGRDFTAVTGQGKKSIFSKIFGSKKPSNPEDRLEDGKKIKPKWYRRKSVILGFAVALLVLLMSYLIVFQWSTATVNVDVKKQDVVASEKVEGVSDIEEVVFDDKDAIQIPIKELKEKDSVSGTTQATGEGKKGDKAIGFVYIFNKSEADVILAAGTKFTAISSGKEFKLSKDTALPAATRAADNSLTPSRTDNVKLEAASFGEEYNLSGDVDTVLTIAGYDGISVLEAKREGNFTGGTTKTFKSVSEENIKKLTEELQGKLKDKLKNNLIIPAGYELIEESLKYSDPKATAFPAKDAEANSDGTFDLSVEIEISAVIVKTKDIEKVIEMSVLEGNTTDEGDTSGNVSLNEIENIETKDFSKKDDKYEFTIAAEGIVSNQITEEYIKNLVKGKSISNATKALEAEENIENPKVKYYPTLIPESIRFVPSSLSRISVNIE